MDVAQPSIKVHVNAKYVAEESNPHRDRYIFAYMITIKNLGEESVQLMGRRWLITDANGQEFEAECDGIVGKHPLIKGHDEYTYTSGTVLETPVGIMQGQYQLTDSRGKKFIANIKPFRLAVPNVLN